MSDEPVLEVIDLHTEIRQRNATVKAVDGVSLTIHRGETVGLVGESGSGKTMTGLSVMRLLPAGGAIVSGEIRVGGRNVAVLSQREMRDVRAREVAMIFQDPMTSLNPTMTVGRQVAEVVRRHQGASRAAARRRASEVLKLVGLPSADERLDDYPHQLSGGLRQRVVIAIALAADPKVLIADEPTTALDVTIQAQILQLQDRLKAELGMGILLITHDMGVIAGHADRVTVMYAGRIVEEGETLPLFTDMQHPYTEALFASIPRLEQERDQPLYTIPGRPPDLSDPPSWCRFQPRCGRARDVCRTQDPQLVGEPGGHRYACFFPVGLDGAANKPVGAAHRLSRSAPAPSESSSVLLRFENVSKEFPVEHGLLERGHRTVKAVSDVSFHVKRGETFGLVGESGCGKTTIGRLICGLEKPDAGSIEIEGADISDLFAVRFGRGRRAVRDARRDVQMMFQDPFSSLDPRITVGATVREPLSIHSAGDRDAQDATVHRLLSEVGLASTAARRYPHEFSGGQRQRIGLARAIALEPKLLVADEPVSALDVSIRSQILNLMRELQDRHRLTYVVISHDLGVTRYLSDRIGVMYLGKLVEVGPSNEVYARPAHPYTAGLIEAIPLTDPVAERGKSEPPVKGELPSPIDPPSGCRFRTRCPRAQRVCAEKEPPMASFGSDHLAACHFPLQPGWQS